MSDTTDWLADQLAQLKSADQSFINKSIYQAAIDLAKEQEKRAQQSQDELDGRIWSPDKWWGLGSRNGDHIVNVGCYCSTIKYKKRLVVIGRGAFDYQHCEFD